MSTIDGLRLRKVLGRKEWHAPQPFGPDSWQLISVDRTRTIFVTAAPFSIFEASAPFDGGDIVHASIAYSDHVTMPSYEDLCLLHKAVFGDGYAYQCFVPAETHINIHETALHLWGRSDGKPMMPDFGKILGSI